MRLKKEGGEIATLLVILAVVVALLFGGYKLIGVAADALAERIPDKLESDLFGSVGGRQSGWGVAETPEQKRAQGIFDKLKATKGIRELEYRLHFIKDDTPNAFAMPGGSLAVTDGLLKMVEGEIGLATVIGHEFGHQQYRHSLKMMGRSLLIGGILMFVIGDTGFLMGLALDMAEKSHSRAQEMEADAYGIKMVHKIYGTTKGSLEFFEKIDDKKNAAGDKVLAMLSTHPYTPERIEALKRIAKGLETR